MKKSFVTIKHLYFRGTKIHAGREVSLQLSHQGAASIFIEIKKGEGGELVQTIEAQKYGLSSTQLFQKLQEKNIPGFSRMQLFLFFGGISVLALLFALIAYITYTHQ